MDPPVDFKGKISPGGTVELQPLVSTGRYDTGGPRDAPEDDVIVNAPPRVAFNKTTAASAAANGTSPAIESVAHALSNEGINNALQRIGIFGTSAFVAIQDRLSSKSNDTPSTNNGISPSSTSNSGTQQPPAPTQDYSDVAAQQASDKQKKMLLLVLITLFVALLGAVLEKHEAVEVELDLEDGETEIAFHESINDIDKKVGINQKETKPIHIIDVDGYQPQEMTNTTFYVLPGTEDFPELSSAKGRPYYPILNHFQHRDPTSDYAKHWGYFDFQDPNSKWDGKMRPQPSNYHEVQNRDVRNSDFPKDAWQSDDEYMKAFLKQAKLLVNRSMEAVYGEYGVGLPEDGSIELSEEDMINREKFFPFILKDTINSPGGGSYSTKQSFDGIARRMIHHIMTGDTFKLVMGGHSAAAGHGAGFNQSFIIEAGHVLEPVFAHLGVEFRAYNFAQGGMGTFQQALAGMDLRNKEADWIYWDSAMTEKPGYIINFFFRQALLAGNRAPVLMGDRQGLEGFHEQAGAAIAAQGNGWVPVTVSDEQVKTVPWAAKYLQCARGATADCKAHEYTAGCWVEREDFKPAKKQEAHVGGAAAWHPGNRIHKRRGRMIAMVVLKSLEYALNKWETLGEEGFPIPEEEWHVTDYYKNIRDKTPKVPGCFGNVWRIGQARRLEEVDKELDEDNNHIGHRHLDDKDFWPSRLCNIPLQGRSLWGPRNNPSETSLLTIMKPNPKGDIDPGMMSPTKLAYYEPPCYQPPDVPAPWTRAPKGEPFAPLIGASRRLETEEDNKQQKAQLRGVDGKVIQQVSLPIHESLNQEGRVLAEGDDAAADDKNDTAKDDADEATEEKNTIVPGYGINVKWGRKGICDGSSHSWCDKSCDSGCLMGGAQDNRGAVCFDGFSGWVVFEINNVKHGFIGARRKSALKFQFLSFNITNCNNAHLPVEPWHAGEETPITNGWTEENNGGEGNYNKRGRERELHEEYQDQQREEGIKRMIQEIEEDIMTEDDPTRRRLGGGQSCGRAGDYTFEWAINGKIVSWNKGKFCEHYTRLNYNLDVIKFMDDETQTGDFELAMRMTNVGRGNSMCVSHVYWA